MFKRFLLLGLLCMSAFAFAKGSSNPGMGAAGQGGFVPYAEGERVFVFTHNRNLNTSEGKLFVCPFDMVEGNKYACYKKDDPKEVSQWVELPAVTPPGYEISGYSFSFVGTQGWRMLTVYYRKIGIKFLP